MDWKLLIIQRLHLRNQKESGPFQELVDSYGKLQDQVGSFKKEVTRLEFNNNELEKQIEELAKGDGGAGGASGGGSVNATLLIKANKKVEDLQTKLVAKTEALVDIQKKWMEVTESVRNVGDELKMKEKRIADLLSTQRQFEIEFEEHKKVIENGEKINQNLTDEYDALNKAFNFLQIKLKQTEGENDRLRANLMSIKARDADRLNEENESFRKKREKDLEEQLQRAAREKEDPLNSTHHIQRKRSSGKEAGMARGESSLDRKVVDEVYIGPSICPDTSFQTFDGHEQEVSALCFSGDGNYMATGGADKVVKLWTWSHDKMEPKSILQGSSASIMSVQFDQHSKMVLAGSNDYSARIWSLHNQQPKSILTGHSNKVMAAKFLEDNLKVVTGSHDRTLKIWDLQHKTCTKTLFAGSSCNDLVTGRGMGTTIISGHFDKRIRFWDLRTTTSNEIALQGKITSLDHYPDRNLLLCCSRDDTLRLIDLRQNSITATFSASGFHVSVDWTRACFSPDGQYVAAGSSDGTLFVWETLTRKMKSRKEHSNHVVVCSWHPAGQLFASADRNKKVVLWKR